jgi:hypothetical protein
MILQKIEEARIVSMLLTDGGITKTHYDRPRSWRIFFASNENFLLSLFKENIEALFSAQSFWMSKSRNTESVYLNNSAIAEYFLEYSPTYRTKQCDSRPICPLLRGQKYGPCVRCEPIVFKEIQYPPSKIPMMEKSLIDEFLKYYFSVEGTVTDRIQISQRHPSLLYQINELLKHFNINASLNYYKAKDNRYEWFLRINKKDFKKFHEQINLLPVQIQNTALTKSERLKRLIQA